jgi:hypothetical protein
MKQSKTDKRPEEKQPVQLELPGVEAVVGEQMDLFITTGPLVEGEDRGSPD